MKQLMTYLLIFCLPISIYSSAQPNLNNPISISLKQALELAQKNYPSIKAQNWNIAQSESQVSLSKLAYLPQLNINLQANYSTLNNIYGLFYPQNAILPISGPVSASNNYHPVLGSAAGILLSWEPYSFGKFRNEVNYSKTMLKQVKDELLLEVFNHKVRLINTYLDWLIGLELILIQQSNSERALVFYRSAKVLATNGLRPGIDTSLAKADMARSDALLIKSREAEDVYRKHLNELLGLSNDSLIIQQKDLRKNLMVDTSGYKPSSDQHPLLQLYQSKVNTLQVRSLAIKSSFYPKINLYSSVFARGSGGAVNGSNDRSLHGLAFSKYNYSFRATLMFYVLDYPSIRSKYLAATYQRNEQEELNKEEKLKLDNENQVALIKLKSAMKASELSGIELEASKESYIRIIQMYASGLSTETDVAQIKFLLNSSEINYAVSRIMIYKAVLYQAEVLGDLDYFLQTIP